MKKAFTLIELLIVIGILSVLVVTILITLNPAEAQKKTRDTKRMKDLAVLEAIVTQWLNDGKEPFCTAPLSIGCTSDSAGKVKAQPCSSNWLGRDLCNYTNTVPVDPLNNTSGSYVNGGTVTAPTVATTNNMYYELIMSGSDYEINVLQESKSNAANVLNASDGGSSNGWAERGTNLNLLP